MSQGEMDFYRGLIRENIDYDGFVRERPYDAGQLDEMVELMVEAVCSKKKNIRVAGNDFPDSLRCSCGPSFPSLQTAVLAQTQKPWEGMKGREMIP